MQDMLNFIFSVVDDIIHFTHMTNTEDCVGSLFSYVTDTENMSYLTVFTFVNFCGSLGTKCVLGLRKVLIMFFDWQIQSIKYTKLENKNFFFCIIKTILNGTMSNLFIYLDFYLVLCMKEILFSYIKNFMSILFLQFLRFLYFNFTLL